MYDGLELLHKRGPCLFIKLRNVLCSRNPRLHNLAIRNHQSIWHATISLFGKIEPLTILVSGLFKLRTPPARERGPNEVVVSKPVIEDRDERLPLRVFLIDGRLLLLLLLLLILLGFSPFLCLRMLIFLVVLWLRFPTPCLLLLHHTLLRRSLHLSSHSSSLQTLTVLSLCSLSAAHLQVKNK
ncbi:hypothetical protein V8G54_007620, partial [Vigna mungo]